MELTYTSICAVLWGCRVIKSSDPHGVWGVGIKYQSKWKEDMHLLESDCKVDLQDGTGRNRSIYCCEFVSTFASTMAGFSFQSCLCDIRTCRCCTCFALLLVKVCIKDFAEMSLESAIVVIVSCIITTSPQSSSLSGFRLA